MLGIENLSSGYGGREVLHSISMKIGQQEAVCVLGGNGAGKSTLIKTIMGYLKPTNGIIRFEDESLIGLPPYEIVKRGISYVPQGDLIFLDLKVIENLSMGSFLEKDKNKISERLDKIYQLFPVLAEKRNQRAGTLSGGQRQMLGIGIQLMTETKLLLLDEPSFGLAPVIRESIFGNLAKLNKEGITILIAEQNVVEALELADRGYIIELGRISFEDTVENLARNRLKIWKDMVR